MTKKFVYGFSDEVRATIVAMHDNADAAITAMRDRWLARTASWRNGDEGQVIDTWLERWENLLDDLDNLGPAAVEPDTPTAGPRTGTVMSSELGQDWTAQHHLGTP